MVLTFVPDLRIERKPCNTTPQVNKGKRISLLLFGLLVMTVFCVVLWANNNRLHGDLNASKTLLKAELDRTHFWRDEHNRSHASRLVAETNLVLAKEVYGKELNALRGDISGLKKNLSNLQSVVTASIQTGGEFRMPLKDTIVISNNHTDTARSFRYRDRWADVSGYFLRDSALVVPKFKDSISFVTYYDKKNWFANRELRIEAISHNPYSTITGIRQIKIAEKRRRFGVGPYVGYGLNGVQVGVGVMYNVIKF